MFLALAALAATLAASPARAPRQAAALPAVPPVTLSGAWTTVGLPAAPLGIAVHNGTIWVCGWDEMIAESTDSGRDWRVRHLQPKGGELLFSFAFFGGGKMAVFGSGGARLSTSDGGASWTRSTFQPALGLSEVAFADAKDGYGINATQVAWTHDGGRSWSFTSKPSYPVAVAALSGPQAAVVVAQWQQKAERVVVTADGGTHWKGIAFPKAWSLIGLYAGGGVYRLYGSQRAAKKGQRRVPVGAVSADGATWRASAHLPSEPPSSCNREGCEFGDDAWAYFPRLAPAWRMPRDPGDPLTAAWAATGDTLCRVGVSLRCLTGPKAWSKPEPDTGAQQVSRKAPKCAHCPNPKFPAAERRRGVAGSVVILTEIGKDGRPSAMIVLAAQTAGFALAGLHTLREWRFHPALKAGKPIAVTAEIVLNFHLYAR